MSSSVLLLHRAVPGRRDDVERVWRAHLPAAVQANAGHVHYSYCFADDDPDQIIVFQTYADRDEAERFLQHPAYQAYLAAVEPLLAGPPEVVRASPRWTKHA